MKIWIASASALLLAAACSASPEATAALEAMNLESGTSSPMIKYTGKSGSGDTITLKDVVLGPGGGQGIKAETLILGGLDMTDAKMPVLKSITIKGIAPEADLGPGLAFKLDTIAIEGLNPVTGEFLASAFTDTPAAEAPPFEQWGFSKISINGMTFNGDLAAMGAGGGKFNVSLGEVSFSDLKETIFGSAKFSGLKGDFDIPNETTGGMGQVAGKFDFGTMDIKTIRGNVFSDMFATAFNAALTDPSALETLDADFMAGLSSPLEGGFDEFTWTGMNAEAAGAKLVVSPTSVKIGRNAELVAISQTSPRTTITLTADSAGGAFGQAIAGGLSSIGYASTTVELYGESDMTFDPATDTTRYANYNLGVTDMVDLKVTGAVQGLTKFMASLMGMMTQFEQSFTATVDDPFAEPGQPTPEPVTPPAPDMSGMEALKVVELDLTLTDKKLVDLALGAAGTAGAGDPATLRNDVVNMLQQMGVDLTSGGLDGAVANELTAALSEFVKRPGALNIKLKPPQPVSMDSPESAFTKQGLGFSATFTPSR
jgi:hypothetical protein